MELKRSVLLPFSAQDVFDVVEQAEHYPQFLPWCTGVTIFERSDEWVAARVDFSYLKFSFGFRTRNPKQRPQWLHVRLVEGPFRRFEADWTFTPLGALGCRVQFAVTYEIAEPLFDRLAAPAVEVVSRAMLEAFVKRAHATLKPCPDVPAELAPAQVPAATLVLAQDQEQTKPAVPAVPAEAPSGSSAGVQAGTGA